MSADNVEGGFEDSEARLEALDSYVHSHSDGDLSEAHCEDLHSNVHAHLEIAARDEARREDLDSSVHAHSDGDLSEARCEDLHSNVHAHLEIAARDEARREDLESCVHEHSKGGMSVGRGEDLESSVHSHLEIAVRNECWGAERESDALRGPATVRRQAHWLAAVRWRRRVEKALASARLTFTQWQVLDATNALVARACDAVSQQEVAAQVELDACTVSQVMRRLEKMGLVSRGISFTGKAWRVFVTSNGIRLLNEHYAHVEAASLTGT